MLNATSQKRRSRSLFGIMPSSDITQTWVSLFSKNDLFLGFVNLQPCKAKVNNINVPGVSLKTSAIYY